MRYIKIISLFFFVVLFSFACSENSFSPDQTESDPVPDINSTKSETSTQSSTSVRYDDLPDLAEYVVDGRKWDHTDLTYYFSNGTGDITGGQEQQAVRDAMAFWADVTPLTFSEVGTASEADIVILWATGDHGDGSAFDGINGVLAHAFYPPPNGGSYAGDAHFDDAETWTLSERPNNSQPMDLVTVVAHEFGHSLGLGHSQVENALMYPYYSGSHRYLAQDDIDGIQSIYGPPHSLSVSISGPGFLNSDELGTWTANVSNNEGSISYKWYRRNTPSDPWSYSGVTSQSYQTSFYNPGSSDQESAVRVDVTSAGESDSAIHPVIVSSSDCNSSTSSNNNDVSTNIPDPCY